MSFSTQISCATHCYGSVSWSEEVLRFTMQHLHLCQLSYYFVAGCLTVRYHAWRVHTVKLVNTNVQPGYSKYVQLSEHESVVLLTSLQSEVSTSSTPPWVISQCHLWKQSGQRIYRQVCATVGGSLGSDGKQVIAKFTTLNGNGKWPCNMITMQQLLP